MLAWIMMTTFLAQTTVGEAHTSWPVEHDHFLGSGSGQLSVLETGLAFESQSHPDHSRTWSWQQIQSLRIPGPNRLVLIDYHDSSFWKLHRDRTFRFTLKEAAISSALVSLLLEHLGSRLSSSLLPRTAQAGELALPVKHRHSLGNGCQGVLTYHAAAISFESRESSHSRYWSREHIVSMGRQSEWNLRLTTRERVSGGQEKTYQFQLKQPLADEDYDRLWRRFFEPEDWLSPSTK